MCFAVAHVPQSQALCDWRVCWPQDVANRQSKFLGSAAGRQPLNPAMPRRVVVAAKHSFSYPGARPCRRPSPKILQPAGVFTFLGVRGEKKEGKI